MKLFLSPTEFIDTSRGIDLSIPIDDRIQSVRAWQSLTPEIEPVKMGDFVGSVVHGASVNFRTVRFSPHGNCTHTECLGHITEEIFSVNKTFNDYFFESLLVSVQPQTLPNNDRMITAEQLSELTHNKKCTALILRTLPNDVSKLSCNYSDTNPPYLDAKCIEILDDLGVEHLLVDLPSVDREDDQGVLAMHRAFWGLPKRPQFHKTITELIFVPNEVADGRYILNLQVTPLENDASPSRPMIYCVEN